jgi:hypothetical protein
LRWTGTEWVENTLVRSSNSKIWSQGTGVVEASLTGGSSEAVVAANGSSTKDARLRATVNESRAHLRNDKCYVQLFNHVLGQSYEAFSIKERDGVFGTDVTKYVVNANGTMFSAALTANTLLKANASKEIVSITDGTAGQVLTTDGSGDYSFQDGGAAAIYSGESAGPLWEQWAVVVESSRGSWAPATRTPLCRTVLCLDRSACQPAGAPDVPI